MPRRLRSIRASLAVSFVGIVSISYAVVVLAAEGFIRGDRLQRHADLVGDIAAAVQSGLDEYSGELSVDRRGVGVKLRNVLNAYTSVHAIAWVNGPRSFSLMPSVPTAIRLQGHARSLPVKREVRTLLGRPRFFVEGGYTFLASATTLSSGRHVLYVLEDIGVTPASNAAIICALFALWLSVVLVSVFAVLWAIQRSLQPLLDLEHALQGALVDEFSNGRGDVLLQDDYPVELGGIISAYLGLMDRLRRVLSHKQLVLSAMSHELLSPIALLLGQARRLQKNGDQLSLEQQNLVEEIVDELRRFSHLTGSLLEVSKGAISRPDLDDSLFSPAQVIISLHDDLRNATFWNRLSFCQSAVEMQGLSGLQCRGAIDLYRQCVLNLIENAIKYSPSGAPVEISCGNDFNASVFAVRVRDFGFGIGVAEQKKVFGSYYRSSELSRDRPGSGIGLALVELLMGKMGGRVDLVESSTSGSVFELTLPVVSREG